MVENPGRIIYDNLDAFSREAVRRQYRLEKGVWEKYGARGRHKALEDARFNLLFLSEAMLAGEPALFVEYVKWLKDLFRGLGFLESSLLVTIDCTFDTVSGRLPPDNRSLVDVYRKQVLAALGGENLSVSFVKGDGALQRLSREYLELLLSRERKAALALVLKAVEDGFPVSDIYLEIFQPVQREVGRRWQAGVLNVAEEHYVTAATQLIMSQLYSRIFATPRRGCRLLATTVGGEYHEMGIRMLADLFELHGWDTYFLGASTPDGSIAAAVRDWKPDVVAVSATMTFNVSHVTGLIGAVRRAGNSHKPGILVGGLPFNIAPGLWQKLGADGYAADGRQAVMMAEQIACRSKEDS